MAKKTEKKDKRLVEIEARRENDAKVAKKLHKTLAALIAHEFRGVLIISTVEDDNGVEASLDTDTVVCGLSPSQATQVLETVRGYAWEHIASIHQGEITNRLKEIVRDARARAEEAAAKEKKRTEVKK